MSGKSGMFPVACCRKNFDAAPRHLKARKISKAPLRTIESASLLDDLMNDARLNANVSSDPDIWPPKRDIAKRKSMAFLDARIVSLKRATSFTPDMI